MILKYDFNYLHAVKKLLANSYKIYAFSFFALSLIPFYPITALLVLNPKTRKFSTYIFWCWSWVLSIGFLIFVRKNKQTIPNEPFVVIANHTSFLDVFMMYQVLPFKHLVFMGKSEILSYPLIKTYFKHLHIPVDRGKHRQAALSLVLAGKKLEQGYTIVIFPEGGIFDNPPPKMSPFKPGAFVLAQRSKVDVLPISFQNHYKLLSEPQNFNGGGRPGIARAFLHPLLDKNEISEKHVDELALIAYHLINAKL